MEEEEEGVWKEIRWRAVEFIRVIGKGEDDAFIGTEA